MTASAKFLFNVDFADREPGAPREPRFSEAELAAAEARGRVAGRAETHAEIEHFAAQMLGTIRDQLSDLSTAQAASAVKAERTAVEIAKTVIKKIMPTYAQHHGLDEIETVVKECLTRAREEPRVVVRVPEALLDSLQSRMADIAASAGFPGDVVLLADSALGQSDCRVEWADGGVERDSGRLWNEIEACLVRAMANLAESSDPSARLGDGGNLGGTNG